MGRITNRKPSATPEVKKKVGKSELMAKQKHIRSRSEIEQAPGSRKMPRRAAACVDFKDKSVCFSGKSSRIGNRREVAVDDERAAIKLTAGEDECHANRRLKDFIFDDADGNPQSVEMLEVKDLFISGLILPLEEDVAKRRERGVRCTGFGRVESWAISGYDEGSPVIWVSTKNADYECIKPAKCYNKIYNLFFEKARICVEVYKKLSSTDGDNSDLTVDELLRGVVRSMSDSKNFPDGTSIKEFIISQGEFIYNELIGLDVTSKKNGQIFENLPVLVALMDETKRQGSFLTLKTSASNSVINQSSSHACRAEEVEDMKLARLLWETEIWLSMKQKKTLHVIASSNKFYTKINEDEIANDYPLPAYYKPSIEELDESVLDKGFSITNPDELPWFMLHNWSLYNSDSRLISLELLPMKPCADIDVTIFGSGSMTTDDGSGFYLDADLDQFLSTVQDVKGKQIFLSAIKEWKVELDSSVLYTSIRTDIAWYASKSILARGLMVVLGILFATLVFLSRSVSEILL